ncbi:SLC13/DASS family transporter [Thalassotalea sp. LPB0316]|uniref:SLC13 family permease n=1 Tax=Thalassotalea sp. LPB0316 TaxID=2769490 RepID=UPI001868EEEE|nr:SLC13 family permease [Thalassotalea sp. LPB0316]QOL27120.1 SLC13/DASS family transporter [Thalassotalea sp. LPB0316]
MNLLKSNNFYLIFAPFAALGFYFALTFAGLDSKPAIAASISLLTVILWISEAIPIPATSLIPFALLPLFGIVDHRAVASSLGSHVILLLMGAFMLSKALEKSNVHERLAIYMIKLVGLSSGKRLVFAFMLAAAILSMWISNTATTLIMLPIALAILRNVEDHRLSIALVLGIAYAASLGGVATPIGTPPNVIFMALYQETTGLDMSFLSWMKVGVPVVVIALPLMAWWLTRHVKSQLSLSLPALKAWTIAERRVLIVFGLTALAWITRQEPFGGWTALFGLSGIGDSTVALAAVVIMFIVPDGKKGRLLDWQTAQQIPWGMLLLFAGGIAIAKGFVASGLSDILGNWLTSFADINVFLLIVVICLVITYLTEITSNTATATLLLPILGVTATSMGHDPLLLMVPATICASCAFMLPVATAPNAIVYGTGKVRIKEMVREGFVLSLITVAVVSTVSYLMLT